MSGKQTDGLGRPGHDDFAQNTDWFTPVRATSTLDEHEADFSAWKSEFPEYDLDSGYSSSLNITEQPFRHYHTEQFRGGLDSWTMDKTEG